MPGVQVPLVIQPTPQALTFSPDTDAHGNPILNILVSMPMATFLITLNEEGGRTAQAQLEQVFGKPSGLTIARDMPDGPNGKVPRQ